MVVEDFIPPRHRQLIVAFTPRVHTSTSKLQYTLTYSAQTGAPQRHTPPVAPGDLHAPLAMHDSRAPAAMVPPAPVVARARGLGATGAFAGARPRVNDVEDMIARFLAGTQ